MDKQNIPPAAQRLILPVNTGTELLIEIVDLKLRIKSLLVGFEHQQYLIIKIAPNDLMGTFRSDAVKESPMFIRYVYKDTVYGFKAQILGVVSTPAKLFFVTYPEKFDEIKVLENARFECILPATAMIGNDIVEITVVDISKDGCLGMIKLAGAKSEMLYKLLRVNKRIDLKVQFPGMAGGFGLVGRVRNLSKGADKIMLGLLFEEMTEDIKKTLEGLISLMHETMRKAKG